MAVLAVAEIIFDSLDGRTGLAGAFAVAVPTIWLFMIAALPGHDSEDNNNNNDKE